jgi:hypothetical protein
MNEECIDNFAKMRKMSTQNLVSLWKLTGVINILPMIPIDAVKTEWIQEFLNYEGSDKIVGFDEIFMAELELRTE